MELTGPATCTHTFSDQRLTPTKIHTYKMGKLCFTQIRNYLLVFLSMPPTHTHTSLLGYIRCIYIQVLPKHSSLKSPAPLLSGTERKGALRARAGGSALCTGGLSAHDRLRASRHSIRCLCLLHILPGTGGSWWQSQQPGPLQRDPPEDTSELRWRKDTAAAQGDHSFFPQQQLLVVVKRGKVCSRAKTDPGCLHTQLGAETFGCLCTDTSHCTRSQALGGAGSQGPAAQPSEAPPGRAGPG